MYRPTKNKDWRQLLVLLLILAGCQQLAAAGLIKAKAGLAQNGNCQPESLAGADPDRTGLGEIPRPGRRTGQALALGRHLAGGQAAGT